MSQAIAAPLTPHSARITEAAPARPFLVVETLDHAAGATMLLTYTYGMEAAPAPTGTTQFTFCADPIPMNTAQFTFCADPGPAATPQLTQCAQSGPTDALGAQSAAPVAAECDAVAGSWI
ncbi:hypothetical protein [Streptomyces sp. NPDC058371]|uniref:hypothetical protein n=1 Tax=Streptomyces sp. NPDC058371 TaxID=3346463 RepID=UPI0036699476